MSTHAAIIQRVNANFYIGIYVHFDGYTDGVGKTLTQHYTTEDKVNELMSLGELSSLGDSLAYPYTVAYCRDRGETLKIYHGYTAKDVARQIDHNGYVYVFDGDEWRADLTEV